MSIVTLTCHVHFIFRNGVFPHGEISHDTIGQSMTSFGDDVVIFCHVSTLTSSYAEENGRFASGNVIEVSTDLDQFIDQTFEPSFWTFSL